VDAIKVSGLSFDYPGKPVLKGINLTLSEGSFTAVLGPNGCGKTTLLKNISGYLKPRWGKIRVLNKSVSGLSARERARMIGYIPHNTAAGFDFTCHEVVSMGRLPYLGRFQWETGTDRKAIQESMELTGTWDLRNRLINNVSGGEMQRVLIARALAQQPKVLLMDEPVSHLDIKFQMDIINLVGRLCDEVGITAVAVLHDINLASRYCSRIVLMKEGRIISTGSAADVITEKNLKKVFDVEIEVLRPHCLVVPKPLN